MADAGSRFVIIDGVQYSRERAKRLGLLVTESKAATPEAPKPIVNAPSESRARGPETARKGQAPR